MVNCRAGCGKEVEGGRGRGGESMQLNQLVIAMQQATSKLSGIKQQSIIIFHQSLIPLASSASLDSFD